MIKNLEIWAKQMSFFLPLVIISETRSEGQKKLLPLEFFFFFFPPKGSYSVLLVKGLVCINLYTLQLWIKSLLMKEHIIDSTWSLSNQ